MDGKITAQINTSTSPWFRLSVSLTQSRYIPAAAIAAPAQTILLTFSQRKVP